MILLRANVFTTTIYSILFISTLLLSGCSSLKRDAMRSVGLEPSYKSGDSVCSEQARQDRNECTNEALLEKKQCIERARNFSDNEYQREVSRYDQKDAICEESYQRALRKWEVKIQQYQRCKQQHPDPFEQPKYCGHGHREPDRRDYCGNNIKPDYDNIIYSRKSDCDSTYKKAKYRCLNIFDNTMVESCGARI